MHKRFTIPPLQVTTTTKTIREVQYIGPDGLPIDFLPGQEGYTGHLDYQVLHYRRNSISS